MSTDTLPRLLLVAAILAVLLLIAVTILATRKKDKD